MRKDYVMHRSVAARLIMCFITGLGATVMQGHICADLTHTISHVVTRCPDQIQTRREYDLSSQ